MRNKKWQKFEDYIAGRLQEIDKHAKATKGSRWGDIQNNCGLHVEAKQRNTKSVTINSEVWKKLQSEITINSFNLPLLALENKEGKRWACLELDDFLDLFIELYKLREGN